jgi:hypothetical protein
MNKGIFYLLIFILIILLAYLFCEIINRFAKYKYIGGNNITNMIQIINAETIIDPDKNLKKIEESLIEFKNALMEYNDIVKNNIIINKFIENKFASSYVYKLATTDDDNLIAIDIKYIDEDKIIYGGEKTPIQKLYDALKNIDKLIKDKPENDNFKKGEFTIEYNNNRDKIIDITFNNGSTLNEIIDPREKSTANRLFNIMKTISDNKTIMINKITTQFTTINNIIAKIYKDKDNKALAIEKAAKQKADDEALAIEKAAKQKADDEDLAIKKTATEIIEKINLIWLGPKLSLQSLIADNIKKKDIIETVKIIMANDNTKKLIDLYDELKKLNKISMLDAPLKNILYNSINDFIKSLLKKKEDLIADLKKEDLIADLKKKEDLTADLKKKEDLTADLKMIDTFFETLLLSTIFYQRINIFNQNFLNVNPHQFGKLIREEGKFGKPIREEGKFGKPIREERKIDKIETKKKIIDILKTADIELSENEINDIVSDVSRGKTYAEAIRSINIQQQEKIIKLFANESDNNLIKAFRGQIDIKEKINLMKKEDFLKKKIYMEEYLMSKISINFKSSTELNIFLNLLKPLTYDEFKSNIHEKIISLIDGQWIKKKNIKKIDTSTITENEYENLWKKEKIMNLNHFINKKIYENLIINIFKENKIMYRYKNYLKKINFLRKKDNIWWFNYKYEEPYSFSKKNKIYIQTLKDKLNEGFNVYIREDNKFNKKSINFSRTDATKKFEISISSLVTENMIAEGIKNNRLIIGDYSIFNENDKELVHLDPEDINIYRF